MMTIATIRGKLNSSIDILMDSIHQVGDVISFDNLTNIIPRNADYTSFFYDCIRFCRSNDSARSFRVDSITMDGDKYQVMVSPVMA